MGKAEAFKQLVMASPELWDVKSAIEYYCDQLGFSGVKRFIVAPQPQQGPPPQLDPSAVRAQIAAQTLQAKGIESAADRQFKAAELAQKVQDAAMDRAARQQEKKLDLARELVIHSTSPEVAALSQNPALTAGIGNPL
jgi:hypothetical protein